MASTSIDPAARRVLSPLNVNKPTTPRSFGVLKGGEATSAVSPRKMAQASNNQEEKRTASLYREVDKGRSDDHDDLDEARPHKKARIEKENMLERKTESPDSKHINDAISTRPSGSEEGIQDRSVDQAHFESLAEDGSIDNDTRFALQSASPASSSDRLEIDGVNDSQNTTLTEPDDVPAGLSFPISATPSMTLPVVRRLTKEEAREKAEALKLRLRLASYRVFTNQITTPWKDLEARTMPLRKLNISQPVRSHDPTPSDLSSPGREQSRSPNMDLVIPSSPPAYTATKPSSPPEVDSARTSVSTQQPPRSIMPLSLSFNMSNQDDHDETNSAAKRSLATEGLLSLMQQQES